MKKTTKDRCAVSNSMCSEFQIDYLRSIQNLSEHLRFRIDVLSIELADEAQHSPQRRQELQEVWRIWATYVDTAQTCGLFTGPHGKDLKSRSTGKDDEGFRSALSECMTCWLFNKQFGMTLNPPPADADYGKCDLLFRCSDGDISTQIKSPRNEKEINKDGLVVGDWSSVLEKQLNAANKQFCKNGCNLLVIAPILWPRVTRYELMKAFLGPLQYAWRVAAEGEDLGDQAQVTGDPQGGFLKLWPGGGASVHSC